MEAKQQTDLRVVTETEGDAIDGPALAQMLQPMLLDPLTGEVLETVDQLLESADRLGSIRKVCDERIKLIKAELWKRTGGDAAEERTRHLAGATRKGTMERGDMGYGVKKLRNILETFPADSQAAKLARGVIVPVSGLQIAATPLRILSSLTTDDEAIKKLRALLKEAETGYGSPSLKVEAPE